MKQILTILALYSSLTALADGEPEQYVCVAETTTGLAYVFDKWQPDDVGTHKWGRLLNRFTPDDYDVVPSEMGQWAWRLWKPMYDSTETVSICEEDFDEDGELMCEGREKFRLKRSTLEFALVSTDVPYRSPFGEDGLWWVFVSHGKCVPMSEPIPSWPDEEIGEEADPLIYRLNAFQKIFDELYEEMYGVKEVSAPPIEPKAKESN